MGQKQTVVIVVKRCTLCGQRFTNDAAFCPFDGEPLELLPAAFDPAADPLIGTLVDGRYHVVEALGEGGMGTVYRVQHKALQRPFAMKVLRRDLAREKELSGRFIQEARTAATINHPNVVQITDFGTLPDGVPYFVMELLEGQPLSTLLKAGGPLPAGRAVRLLMQVAAGIGAAHRAGIIHRDLKPDNIFVFADQRGADHVKILDFGVAKVAGSAKLTRTGMVFGSPHYMSPEQASGQPVDHRADIYALGVVMYQLFTGHVPFEADTFMGVLTKHMFMSPEPFVDKLGAVSDLGALEDITLRCLEKKPENRFPTIDALVADVQDMVQLGSGADFDVRPSRVSGVHRPSGDFRLADELELPLPYEVNAARNVRARSDSRYYWALGAVALAVLLLTGAVASLLWVHGGREKALNPFSDATTVQASVAIVPPPAPAPPEPATAAPVVSAEPGSHETEAVEPPPPPTPTPPPPSTAPAKTAKAVRPAPPAKKAAPPAPAAPATTKAGSATGSSEIVNPWAK